MNEENSSGYSTSMSSKLCPTCGGKWKTRKCCVCKGSGIAPQRDSGDNCMGHERFDNWGEHEEVVRALLGIEDEN